MGDNINNFIKICKNGRLFELSHSHYGPLSHQHHCIAI